MVVSKIVDSAVVSRKVVVWMTSVTLGLGFLLYITGDIVDAQTVFGKSSTFHDSVFDL